jgi:hypothetical protein
VRERLQTADAFAPATTNVLVGVGQELAAAAAHRFREVEASAANISRCRSNLRNEKRTMISSVDILTAKVPGLVSHKRVDQRDGYVQAQLGLDFPHLASNFNRQFLDE